MDKKGPGAIRGLGSFEGLHPPFIDLTLCRRPKHARSRLKNACNRRRNGKPAINTPADFERELGQFLSERKKSGRSPDSSLAGKPVSGSGILYVLRSMRAHCIAWRLVTAAENHFLAPNDNHDIANRRVRITPDRNCRRSVFAGHRNIFLCPKAFSGWMTRAVTAGQLQERGP
jgi:hypothetical protein